MKQRLKPLIERVQYDHQTAAIPIGVAAVFYSTNKRISPIALGLNYTLFHAEIANLNTWVWIVDKQSHCCSPPSALTIPKTSQSRVNKMLTGDLRIFFFTYLIRGPPDFLSLKFF